MKLTAGVVCFGKGFLERLQLQRQVDLAVPGILLVAGFLHRLQQMIGMWGSHPPSCAWTQLPEVRGLGSWPLSPWGDDSPLQLLGPLFRCPCPPPRPDSGLGGRGDSHKDPRCRDQNSSSSGILPVYQVSEITSPLGPLAGRKFRSPQLRGIYAPWTTGAIRLQNLGQMLGHALTCLCQLSVQLALQ